MLVRYCCQNFKSFFKKTRETSFYSVLFLKLQVFSKQHQWIQTPSRIFTVTTSDNIWPTLLRNVKAAYIVDLESSLTKQNQSTVQRKDATTITLKSCHIFSNFLVSKSCGSPFDIYLLQVINRNTKTMCEIYPKLTIKTTERYLWRRSGDFVLVSLLLT